MVARRRLESGIGAALTTPLQYPGGLSAGLLRQNEAPLWQTRDFGQQITALLNR
jgi:hypothetical protein